MKDQRLQTGRRGEEIALEFLRRQGYQLLHKNYRCSLGEIDLVTRDGNNTVFVEVRSRSSTAFGWPQESVTRPKQERLRRLALYYLQQTGTRGQIRFDVIAIMFNRAGELEQMEHIKGAW